MKRVSAKVFFTVLWRGLCQALGWFFGLFGYKRDGSFAKCVWGLFAISAAIIVAIMAVTISIVALAVISELSDAIRSPAQLMGGPGRPGTTAPAMPMARHRKARMMSNVFMGKVY